jgi:hypothetical protein
MVTRLDRLARSTRNLLNTLAAITAKKAGFRSLGDTWADTTTSQRRLMLTVLGGLAEFERDLIRARTSEGRERAKARGVKMGRPHKLTDHHKREAIKRRERGRRIPYRNRAQLQRECGDDFKANGMNQTALTTREQAVTSSAALVEASVYEGQEMNTAAKKAERERRVFQKFITTSKLSIVPESVESRPPPEPDTLLGCTGRSHCF